MNVYQHRQGCFGFAVDFYLSKQSFSELYAPMSHPLADPVTPGATISAQSELLSCLASLRPFPAILTLFLIPSCSALLSYVLPG